MFLDVLHSFRALDIKITTNLRSHRLDRSLVSRVRLLSLKDTWIRLFNVCWTSLILAKLTNITTKLRNQRLHWIMWSEIHLLWSKVFLVWSLKFSWSSLSPEGTAGHETHG